MPAIWTDGFDCYAAAADATAGYWDSGTVGFTLVAGRFSGSQAIQNSANTTWLVKTTTGTTDNNHHISCAFQQTAAISGTTLGMYFQLSDGATNQVCIVFRSDGAILLTSATPGGTVLDTYTGAFTAASTWYQFEFEIVIHNTAGSWAVRKLGNTSNDRATGGLNTRPGANAQASKLTVGQNATVTSQQMDDLLWRSDTTAVSFSGDIRCQTRRPASDASVQWTRSGSIVPVTTPGSGSSGFFSVNTPRYTTFTAPCTGTIATVGMPVAVASTANFKCTIYASSGTAPTTVLGSATPISAPGVGTATFTFGTPVAVTQGTQYWVAFCPDAGSGQYPYNTTNGSGWQGTTTYASFPAANPTGLSATNAPVFVLNITATTNSAFVADVTQDAASSYVYSSNVGDSDLYGISSIATTPASIVAVTTRAYLQKSDAGTRIVRLQLKSGGTTVQSSDVVLNTVFGWGAMTHTLDPATGAAWTAVGVANAQIGVIVTA